MDVTRLEHETFDWASGAGGASDVRRVLEAATEADGRSALNEAAQLTLRNRGLDTGILLVGSAAGPVGGFAYVHGLSGVGRPELDLVVAPAERGRGLGTALARAALAAVDGIPVTAWSHGNHPAAGALAARLGFAAVRELWLMRRPTPPRTSSDPVAIATTSHDVAGEVAGKSSEPVVMATGSHDVAGGYRIRGFRVGEDEEGLLAVNAAAFADHPEQGSLDRAGLAERMAEDWFDAAGLLLAEREGRIAGFHWTKVHPGAGAPTGEVYVIGVDPSAQGSGLGRALLVAGLDHLERAGVGEVVLYVEGANRGAIRLYESFGFTHAARDTDVMYASPS
jgi:mycothiol synthase